MAAVPVSFRPRKYADSRFLVECKRQWLASVRSARALFDRLPAGEVGCLYLDAAGKPVTPDPASAEFPALRRHFGSVRGAWPVIRE
jgi:hypothetical protein